MEFLTIPGRPAV